MARRHYGFTLIEILVVIAIIGLFAGIIFAGLYNSRIKSANTFIQSEMDTLRAQATLYYENNGNTYGPAPSNCADGNLQPDMFDPTNPEGVQVQKILTAIITQLPNGSNTYIRCTSGGQTWMVQVQLKNNVGYWCVDDTGASKLEGSFATAGSTDCQ